MGDAAVVFIIRGAAGTVLVAVTVDSAPFPSISMVLFGFDHVNADTDTFVP